MKAALLVFLAISALALKAPLKNDVDAIEASLRAAREIQFRIESRDADRFAQPKENDPEEYERKTAQLAIERDDHYNRAILRTLTAYGIVPAKRDGTPDFPKRASVFPGAEGKSVIWTPHMRKNEALELVLSNGSKANGTWIPPGNIAGTTVLGFTNFRADELEKLQPHELALTLIHEKEHFLLYATKGKGDKLTRAERELAALDAEEAALSKLGLPTEVQDRYRNRSIAMGRQKAKKDLQTETALKYSPKRILDPNGVNDKLFGNRETDEEIAKIRDEAEAFARRVKEEARERHFTDLAEIAQRCCFPPIDGSPCVDPRTLTDLRYQSVAEYQAKVSVLPSGSCQDNFFSSIMQKLAYGEKLSTDWLDRGYATAWDQVLQANPPKAAPSIDPMDPARAQIQVVETAPAITPKLAPIDGAQRLASLTRFACSGSNSIRQEHLEGLRWFGSDVRIGLTFEVENQLEGCSLRIFREALNRHSDREPLTVTWLNDQATAHGAARQPYETPVGGSEPGSSGNRDALDLSKPRRLVPKLTSPF